MLPCLPWRPRGFRKRIEKAYWVIAIMPTTALKQVVQVVGGEIDYITDKALWIHEFQYNGPDPQGVLSPYPDYETAIKDVQRLVEVVRRLARQ